MSGVQPANADAPVPSIFESRKRKILADLSVPDAEYTDLSPKGSVDVAIRDLIREINDVPGLVTTSSCAGRISVFLEGRKKVKQTQQKQQQLQTQEEGEGGGQARQFVPSGGKGAGRWLFVSHDPLLEGEESEGRWRGEAGSFSSLHELFGMVKGDGRPPKVGGDGSGKGGRAPRLVRFHYDPMILHIMTATLNHANPVLSAASSAGFRESGLQSLRCLEGEDGPSPIVAVRSAGLSLESVIGYCEDDGDDGDDDSQPVVRSLVTEEYLEMLIAISNERFAVNGERKERFRASLSKAYSVSGSCGAKSKGKAKPPGWEDPEARRKRMREEGLMRKKKLLESQGEVERTSRDGEDDSIDS